MDVDPAQRLRGRGKRCFEGRPRSRSRWLQGSLLPLVFVCKARGFLKTGRCPQLCSVLTRCSWGLCPRCGELGKPRGLWLAHSDLGTPSCSDWTSGFPLLSRGFVKGGPVGKGADYDIPWVIVKEHNTWLYWQTSSIAHMFT